jgi:subtilisin family serine protease
VHVINISIAGARNDLVKSAVNRARKKGVVAVASAGNGGAEARPYYPAAYKNVIAVTAFDRNKSAFNRANTGKYIDFAAPGVNIYTAGAGGTGEMQSGTSFAAPYVSVLVALQAATGRKSPGSLRKILRRGALDLGKPGKDQTFG